MLCLYCYTSPKLYTFAQQKVYHVIFFSPQNLVGIIKSTTFASHLEKCTVRNNAAIAQLVERNLAKVEVASPSLVCRS